MEKNRGRVERRTLVSTESLNKHLDWPGVGQVCQLTRERTVKGVKTVEVAYFVTSLKRHAANADALLALARRHWAAIENGLHYVRDVTLGEDASPIYRGDAPQNLAALRNGALNWLRRQGVGKFARSLRQFAWNPSRLFAALGILK